MCDVFNVCIGRAVSVLTENDWSPDSRKALHFTCYDQLQQEYEDEDFQPRTEFLPSLAINQMCCRGLASPQLASPASLNFNIFMLFAFPLQSVHTHTHAYTPFSTSLPLQSYN